MIEEDYIYFAEELNEVTPRMIPSSFGDIYAHTAGIPGQPLIIVVHGSGPTNSADQYHFLLHQYLVRVSYLQKFYIVAIDCPGYGRSKGSKEAVKTFPLQMFKQILKGLGYKTYFAMFGHSQGGAAIFNAVHEDPSITQFLVMDRPVCGNIQRFNKFSMPTLLIYDIEDDGHPIWQGKLLYKELSNTQFYTYRNSIHPYWVPDHIWNKMLGFFSKQHKSERKNHFDFGGEKKSRSYSKPKSGSTGLMKAKMNHSVDRVTKIKKEEIQGIKLLEIEEIQRSELMSIQSRTEHSDQNQLEEKPDLRLRQESQHSSLGSESNKMTRPPRLIEFRVQPQRQKPPKKREQSPKRVEQSPRKIEQSPQLPQQIPSQVEDNNRCSICYQTLYRPVATNCNHTFCSKCILQSLLVNQKCPLCRTKITKKTQNKELQEKIVDEMTEKELFRRQNDFKQIDKMMKSIVFIEIGNTSRQLETKQSAFRKTKKKYNWQLFVKQPKNFPIEQVSFDINMGNSDSRPVKVRNAPFTFESRGTFSFACEIIIKPRKKEYPQLTSIYRIDIEPGYHSKKVALKMKNFMK